jgi:hypothetical protein
MAFDALAAISTPSGVTPNRMLESTPLRASSSPRAAPADERVGYRLCRGTRVGGGADVTAPKIGD